MLGWALRTPKPMAMGVLHALLSMALGLAFPAISYRTIVFFQEGGWRKSGRIVFRSVSSDC